MLRRPRSDNKSIDDMSKHLIIILVSSLTIFSCNDSKKNASKIGKQQQQLKWDKITLRTDFQSIEIYADRDTIISNTWGLKDSLVKSDEVWHIPTNKKQERIYLEPSSKDTIYYLVMDMITKPVFTDQSATCYAGNIKICIQSDNTELCCRYSSVGDWTTISGNTKKLFAILNGKTKISIQ